MKETLSDREKQFVAYWEANRDRQKKLFYQLTVGLPLGLGISIFILVNFYSGWFTRAEMVANSSFNPMVLYVALFCIVIFIAIFSKKFQWDQREQQYKEILSKLNKPDAAKPVVLESEESSDAG